MHISRGREGQAYRVELSSLTLWAGEAVAIVGPSGCGKSTLLEALGLILKPERVSRFQLLTTNLANDLALRAGHRETQWARLRQHQLGYVPQTGGLLPFLTVRQNIDLPASMSGRTTQGDLLDRLVERLKLKTLLNRFPRELSIGERQRVSFARAVAHQPALILADEPTAALDPNLAHELFALILEIVHEFNIAALIVTHEWSLVAESKLRKVVAIVQADHRTVFDEQP
ncbi:MAG: ATP-binding cassette domain-containing protein [Alcaligenaceae bacterium]